MSAHLEHLFEDGKRAAAEWKDKVRNKRHAPTRPRAPRRTPGSSVKVAGIGFGFEYYGSLGPLTSPRLSIRNEHLLFEAIHIFTDPEIELSFGVGEALSDTQNKLIFKTIVGYTFDLCRKQHLDH
jgi:2-keto-4-pentenoate hydratase/2-oxohepta-3-ene-1,7-dioic acid hydratase in catechol pathway